jgi:hypothetical protein
MLSSIRTDKPEEHFSEKIQLFRMFPIYTAISASKQYVRIKSQVPDRA